MTRLGVAVLLLLALTVPASARPELLVIDDPNAEIGERRHDGLAPYNRLFLNRCAAGCVIRVGPSSSVDNTWSISSQRTLTAFPYGDAVWAQVV
ncbi:MAG TPA: hypothetical protein VIV11_19830, partial [Kofleriaceae bacterium]